MKVLLILSLLVFLGGCEPKPVKPKTDLPTADRSKP